MSIHRAFQTGTNVSLTLAVVLSSQLLLASTFTQTNLVSDVPGVATTTDPNLKNPWGVAFVPGVSPLWVSNQASGTSTLYNGAGVAQKLVVTIPAGTPPATGPTGQVFNSTAFSSTPGFDLPNGNPALFIFDTLNGTIDGWNTKTLTTAVQTVSSPGSVYTGLALASSGGSNYLYAADSTGKIRVFDSSYKPVTLAGNFTDPKAISGYVPFNIRLMGSSLYVTYAKLTPFGIGLPGGYVDVFNTNGMFVNRVATGGALYAPWGLAMAPASGFGTLSGDLLVGNFGNGEILAYNPSGAYAGTLNDTTGKPIVNDFLWSLNFDPGGPGVSNPDALYFTAGINNQKDGLFGTIDYTPEPRTVILAFIGFAALILVRRRPLKI